MERFIEIRIEELKRKLVLMGAHVEKALEVASHALLNREQKGFQKVHDFEKKINAEQVELDYACLELLAKQGPVAKDLRFVISVIKINTDLERMGDQCVNIAHNSKDYLEFEPITPNDEIPLMVDKVRIMVKDALDAFVLEDITKAKSVVTRDDEVDLLKNQVFRRLEKVMMEDPQKVRPALNLILIARNLERLGDHATNIAEDVIYAYTGRDIRHRNESQSS
jgi:phosphate transport system protein